MEVINLPIDGEMVPFTFNKVEAQDKDMDKILKSLVNEIGPLKGSNSSAEKERSKLCLNNDEAHVLSSLGADLQMDKNLNPEQNRFLSTLFIQSLSLQKNKKNYRTDFNALGAQIVRKVNFEGFSYMVLMPLDNDETGEVLYYANDNISAGVDWLDFVFELLVGIIGLMFAIGVGGTLGKIAKALRKTDMFDRLKGLLASPTFRALLKKLAGLIPGGKKSVEIYEVLKEIIQKLWETVIKPGLGDVKKALGKAISLWGILLAGLSWLVRFLSGGAAILAELALLLAALGLKVLAKDDETA
jgi:hypothetical protein